MRNFGSFICALFIASNVITANAAKDWDYTPRSQKVRASCYEYLARNTCSGDGMVGKTCAQNCEGSCSEAQCCQKKTCHDAFSRGELNCGNLGMRVDANDVACGENCNSNTCCSLCNHGEIDDTDPCKTKTCVNGKWTESMNNFCREIESACQAPGIWVKKGCCGHCIKPKTCHEFSMLTGGCSGVVHGLAEGKVGTENKDCPAEGCSTEFCCRDRTCGDAAIRDELYCRRFGMTFGEPAKSCGTKCDEETCCLSADKISTQEYLLAKDDNPCARHDMGWKHKIQEWPGTCGNDNFAADTSCKNWCSYYPLTQKRLYTCKDEDLQLCPWVTADTKLPGQSRNTESAAPKLVKTNVFAALLFFGFLALVLN